MSKVLVTESNLQDIADAIRSKNQGSDTYRPGDMAAAILAIPVGGTLVSKTITQNGEYDPEDDNADGYSDVTVNVPNSYTAGDEGKVVSSGALVAQTSRSVTENGTYDTTENNEVVVNVSGGGGAQGVFRGTSAPQAGVGNNGDYYIQDIPLPSSINYLEYLESSGTQYIDTNIKGDKTTTAYVKFRTVASNPDGAVFGARQSNGNRQFCVVQNKTAGSVRLDYNNTSDNVSVTLSPDTEYEFIHGQVVYNASGKIAVITAGTGTFETPGGMYIFGMNNNGSLSTGTGVKIYRLTIRKNGLVVADFIPAFDENNVPCMYEAVSGTYYYNAGSGTFGYGSAMSPMQSNNVYKKVGGTWSVITQSGVCTV